MFRCFVLTNSKRLTDPYCRHPARAQCPQPLRSCSELCLTFFRRWNQFFFLIFRHHLLHIWRYHGNVLWLGRNGGEATTCQCQQRFYIIKITRLLLAFGALTLLAGHQEQHQACENWSGVGVVFCLGWGADCLYMVQLMPLPSQNPNISWLI